MRICVQITLSPLIPRLTVPSGHLDLPILIFLWWAAFAVGRTRSRRKSANNVLRKRGRLLRVRVGGGRVGGSTGALVLVFLVLVDRRDWVRHQVKFGYRLLGAGICSGPACLAGMNLGGDS